MAKKRGYDKGQLDDESSGSVHPSLATKRLPSSTISSDKNGPREVRRAARQFSRFGLFESRVTTPCTRQCFLVADKEQ